MTITMPAQADPIAVTQVAPPSYEVASRSPDWAATPDGLAFKPCIHEVPDGAAVSADGVVTLNGTTIANYGKCAYSGTVSSPSSSTAQSGLSSAEAGDPSPALSPTTGSVPATAQAPLSSGWWATSWWTSSPQIVSVSAQWVVPSNPSANGALVYLFPSIETTEMSAIVQPVLQWGMSPAGGGNYWAIADWFVTGDGGVYHSSLQQTVAGRTIVGTMTRASGTSSDWTVSFTDTATGQGKSFPASTSLTSWTQVQGGVLEAYGVTSCTQLPQSGTATFSGIEITSTSGKMTPSFTAGNYSESPLESCGASAAATNTSTTLYWAPGVDVSTTDTFYSSIMWAYSTGLTAGSVVNGVLYYLPSNSVNRGSMAAFLYRLAGSPSWTPPVKSPFTDVATTDTFYSPITWLYSKGITAGIVCGSSVCYQPSNPVNRGSMSAFLYRLAGSPSWKAPTTSPFADVKTTDTFYSSITWLYSQGITAGVTTNGVLEYQPANPVNRGSMAAFMSRMSNKQLYCGTYTYGIGC